jgi:hypothetical protein
MTHHNQSKELATWFSNLPLNEFIDNKKIKVWSSNPKPHEAQLEDQKSQERLKKVIKKREKPQGQQKAQKAVNQGKEKEKLTTQTKSQTQTPPKTLNARSPP